jgi:hypothetical protein
VTESGLSAGRRATGRIHRRENVFSTRPGARPKNGRISGWPDNVIGAASFLLDRF